MLSVSTPLSDTIKKSLAVHSSVRVVAEWNMNRYITVSTVDNFGSDEVTSGYDLDLFPIESIIEAPRPTAGILRAKTSEGVVTSGYGDTAPTRRSYTVSIDDKYKYWTSQQPSGSSVGAGGGYTMPTNSASPYIIYSKSVWTNKIYLCFENSWASPKTYNIDVTTDGTTWTTIGTNVAPNSKGQVILYLQADNSWGTSVYQTNAEQLKGLRVVCTEMNRADSYLNVIEMGLRLENDLSDYVLNYSVEQTLSEDDFVSPLGTISANTGSVALSNIDGRFSNEGPASNDPYPLYRGIIDANVLFTIDAGIDTSGFGGVGTEYVRQATMYADGAWAGDIDQKQVSLKDGSKFLQEVFPNAMLMENVSIGQAIWRLLDSMGFNFWNYSKSANQNNVTNITYFWTDPQKNVWQTIQEICRSTQSACYFDAFGILQIKTRESAFDTANLNSASNWSLDYALNGAKQPDIINLNQGNNFEANYVKIGYRATQLAVDDQQRPISEIVWQPQEDSVVLRSSGLAYDMDATQMYFYINKTDAPYWQYDGMVNIRGEWIKYKGKEYRYIDTSNQWQTTILYSADDKRAIDNDKSSDTLGWQNYFTGKLIATERGVDWTTAAAHASTIQPWLNMGPRFAAIGQSNKVWTGGMIHIPQQTLLRMQANKTFQSNVIYMAPRGSVANQPPTILGTRIKFPSNPQGAETVAGMHFYGNSAGTTGYYLELQTTDRLSVGNRRASANEVKLYKRVGSTYTSISGNGATALVTYDNWYDIDIRIQGSTFSVSLNGRPILTATDSSLGASGIAGLFVRAYTIADFEYFYYASGYWPSDDPDNSSFLDLVHGGYYSTAFYKDAYYDSRSINKRIGKKTWNYKQNYNQRAFDEFGMQVHEMRQYDILFDKKPVVYSDLYISNTDQSVVVEYAGNSFGSSFLLANASRQNAVIHGEDTLTFPGNTVTQKMMVTARTVQQQDEKVYEVKNDQAIRARGEITLDISSDWLQSEDAAKSLGDWIINHWSQAADSVDVEIFGNPILEVGDIVGINYSPLNMSFSTHKYFVLRVSHTWDTGLKTTLHLRRAR